MNMSAEENRKQELKKKYNDLFSDEDKALAFDKIAECYYYANFGKMQKSDFETLLFSIYIEQILKQNEENMDEYSDYKLSKVLGIPQNKVSNLKERKELQYPYEGFDWKKSFLRICQNAKYDAKKIILNIPDKNLFNEVRNCIEQNGGYIDLQLNTKVLKVAPEYYIDVLAMAMPEDDIREIKKEFFAKMNLEIKEGEDLDKALIGDAFQKSKGELVIQVLSEVVSNHIGISSETVKESLEKGISFLKKCWAKIREHN